jgi:hypothetical protein
MSGLVGDTLKGVLLLKLKQHFDQMDDQREANAAIGKMISSMAVMYGNTTALEEFKEPLTRIYGKQGYEKLLTGAEIMPGLLNIAQTGDEAFSRMGEKAGLRPEPPTTGLPSMTPEDFGVPSEVMAEVAPQAAPRFEPPPKAIMRHTVTSEGKVTFRVQDNPLYDENMDAEWARRHLTNRMQGVDRIQSLLGLATPDPQTGWPGWIPSEVLSKADDWTDDEKKKIYGIAVHILTRDGKFREQVQNDKGSDGQQLEDDVLEQASITAGLKFGWYDEWAAPFFSGITDYKHREKMAQDREIQIHTEQTRRDLEETKPIEPEVAAEYGIALGPHGKFPTYAELVQSGHRFMNEQDRKLYETVSATLTVFDQLFKQATELFTSEDDYASRSSHGIWLKGQKIAGTDIGVNMKDYEDAAKATPRMLLPLVGEQGGRFTDKDMEQIMGLIPGAGLMPSGKKDVQLKKDRLMALLLEKLSLVYAPRLIKMKGGKVGGGGVPKPTHKVVGGKLVPIGK